MENTPWKMRSSRHSSGFQNKAKFLFYAIYFEIRLRYKSELSEHDCPNDPVFQKKKIVFVSTKSLALIFGISKTFVFCIFQT